MDWQIYEAVGYLGDSGMIHDALTWCQTPLSHRLQGPEEAARSATDSVTCRGVDEVESAGSVGIDDVHYYEEQKSFHGRQS